MPLRRNSNTCCFGQYDVALFGRNITNEEEIVGGIDFNNLTGFVNEPRIVGVSLNLPDTGGAGEHRRGQCQRSDQEGLALHVLSPGCCGKRGARLQGGSSRVSEASLA